jgi:hypothetical protein
MPSLVSKEQNEEIDRWVKQAYKEAKEHTEETARKLNQLAHEESVKAIESRTAAKSIYLAGTIVVCIWVVAIMLTWWIKS